MAHSVLRSNGWTARELIGANVIDPRPTKCRPSPTYSLYPASANRHRRLLLAPTINPAGRHRRRETEYYQEPEL